MAARIPRTRLVLTAHNSLVPFLYQTRTLTAPLWYTFQNTAHLRSTYSTNTPSDEATQNDNGESSQDSNSAPTTSDPPSQTVNDAPKPRRSYLQRRAGAISAPEKKPTTQIRQPLKSLTMTQGERMAFGELLGQVGLSRKDTSTTETGAEANKEPKKPMSDSDRNEMLQLSAIFDSVLNDIKLKASKRKKSQAKSDGISAASEGETSEIHEKLRRFQDGDIDIYELSDDTQIPLERIIGSIVQRESAKIETTLRVAIEQGKGDTEVWGICKERIFSLMHQTSEPNVTSEAVETNETQPEQSDALEIPTSIPVEPVVTALYPKVLLVAFRLLNSHFPNSPLIGQFRSTIKSHGRTSAVLGTSTGLYNELIYFYWRGCNDIPGVVSLLQEMEVTGVQPDQKTVGLLNGIVRQRERDLTRYRQRARQENRPSTREPWWDMAPNRKAMRELLGPEGWMHRIVLRVQDMGSRQRGNR
ncbi:hypothetical protein ASPWEDRAFT_144945 [Aspergillus wentii DTO 134E9]|uniref:Mtf2-like C-terminal domain-containing protein n=1 Tax=Aspergillus wentii DTO 134E9 TaxID=1073089 RepID=A0A1L9RZT3_ASPWE|nr:uncharacterized protein ASPWEDRAFT_144945 [Aspergillus wentii DTO 134E9]OJJ40357.1 hypothetical protein ASPWEDRAFT_144945 [Aspergillus wentii DTO 134E9]